MLFFPKTSLSAISFLAFLKMWNSVTFPQQWSNTKSSTEHFNIDLFFTRFGLIKTFQAVRLEAAKKLPLTGLLDLPIKTPLNFSLPGLIKKYGAFYLRITCENTPRVCWVTVDTSRRWSFGILSSPGSLRFKMAGDSVRETWGFWPCCLQTNRSYSGVWEIVAVWSLTAFQCRATYLVIFSLPTSISLGAFSHRFATYLGTLTSHTPRFAFDRSKSRSICESLDILQQITWTVSGCLFHLLGSAVFSCKCRLYLCWTFLWHWRVKFSNLFFSSFCQLLFWGIFYWSRHFVTPACKCIILLPTL